MVRTEPVPYQRNFGASESPADAPLPTAVLHSGGQVTHWSRWSYACGPARLALRCDAATLVTTLRGAGGICRSWDDPREALRWLGQQAGGPAEPGPPFKGGWVGWIGYDAGRLFEDLPPRKPDPLGLPLFEFTCHTEEIGRASCRERV